MWSARRSHRVVVVDDRLVLIGGAPALLARRFARDASGRNESRADVWTAADACASWDLLIEAAPFGPRDGHAAASTGVSHDGKIFLLGGASAGDELAMHDVWLSEDGGATWSLLTATPGWCGRTHHEAVVFGDSMLLLGGFGEFGYESDVWQSRGGKVWRRICARSSWTPRAMHAAATHRGNVYLAGGSDGNTFCRDVWVSSDGSWSCTAANAPVLKR
ncbi:hypothetical protein M885DRAFT_573404 [Pelagophyceae sp. CCMP2097]|nr:hypothetical protein M885DRAFT_573404 [Pelagophyceae sp. CCMP2097]